MLLGCCHCGTDESESTPPSQSVSSESVDPSESDSLASSYDPNIYGTCMGNICGGVFPRRYRINVVDNGIWFPARPCCVGAFGEFTLNYVSHGFGVPVGFIGIFPSDSECHILYESEERAFDSACGVLASEPRFRLGIMADRIPGPVAGVRAGVVSYHGGTGYRQSWTRFWTIPNFPCLGSLVLNFPSAGSVSTLFDGTCWGYRDVSNMVWRTSSVTAVPV